MSQKRARLRALASFGLSILALGTIVPSTAAASDLAVAAYVQPDPGSGRLATILTPDDLNPDLLAVIAPPPVAVAKRAVLVPAPILPETVAASTRVIALAEKHLGARYAHGATGPYAFDCSGLVYRVFEDAGLGRTIDYLQSASALYSHFRALHKTSTGNPQPGDLVIFGHGSHVGIYIGGGKVIHAMITGVAITRVSAVIPSFTTYVHLGLASLRLPVAGH
ncbi:MAG TPA: NlpC/P60 family protein [Candidatus Limnocylindrales bacterium]|nr:NlpC/P60 family protein [Candidatus Limnocylindrales bacterium]